MVAPMDRRPIHVNVAGQRYKVISSSPESDVARLAAAVDAKVSELTPPGRAPASHSIVLAAIALAHDLELERARRRQVEVKVRDLLRRILLRIDHALDSSSAEGEGARSE